MSLKITRSVANKPKLSFSTNNKIKIKQNEDKIECKNTIIVVKPHRYLM